MNAYVGHMAEHKVAPWIEKMARVGFAAKGVLYVTIGALAVMAALGQGGSTSTDNREAMSKIYDAPFGRALLGVMALGLAGYAVWRIIEGIRDPEHRGKDAKGIAIRTGQVVRGLLHLALAGAAASLVLYQSSGGGQGGGDRAKHWSARALELPGGVYILWAVAGILVGYGAYQLYRACKKNVDKHLYLKNLHEGTQKLLFGVSRFGIAARGIVFGTIGVLFANAARHHNASETGGLAESMQRLVQLGKWPFFAIAAGVVAYGLYQFICAKYRRIET
ncbi:MAG: DUF1206 domain-containing protein [Deltaproteobacteria bacterium]|nr:DUF1206 domain-containing protein [Deltaproteobacteria bacterium]